MSDVFKLRVCNPGNKTGETYVLSVPTKIVNKYKIAEELFKIEIDKEGELIGFKKIKDEKELKQVIKHTRIKREKERIIEFKKNRDFAWEKENNKIEEKMIVSNLINKLEETNLDTLPISITKHPNEYYIILKKIIDAADGKIYKIKLKDIASAKKIGNKLRNTYKKYFENQNLGYFRISQIIETVYITIDLEREDNND